MIVKEESIQEIQGWLRAKATALGLKAVKRTQTVDPDRDKFPAVFIHEGDDRVVKHSNTKSGYPAVRSAEIIFETWADRNAVDIKALHVGIRSVVFGGTLSNQCEIREVRAFGPFGSAIPNILVMQLVVGITYKDSGLAS